MVAPNPCHYSRNLESGKMCFRVILSAKMIGHRNINLNLNYFIMVCSNKVVPVFMLRWPIFFHSTILSYSIIMIS